MTKRLSWLIFAAAIVSAAALSIFGCSSDSSGAAGGDAAQNGGGKDTGTGEGDGDGGGTDKDMGTTDKDGGTTGKDAGGWPIGGLCTARDQECPPNQICDFEHAKCVEGKGCPQGHANCAYQQDNQNPDYCGTDGINCYCDAEGKTCKRRLLLCEPCGSDEECGGNASEADDEDRCIDYPEGKRCGKACGALRCPVGFECVAMNPPGSGPNPNQCRPMRPTQADPFSCAAVTPCASDADCTDPAWPKCYVYIPGAQMGVCSSACEDDNDCPADVYSGVVKICNPDTGSCVPGCVRPDGTVDNNKCAPPQICHPNGRCAFACDETDDCNKLFGDAVGWFCEAGNCKFCLEKNPDGTCAKLGCLNDAECSFPGYCDKVTRECQDNKCRDEKDCLSGNKCVNSECIEMNCVESGGAAIECNVFEFCCGEGKATNCVDPSGQTVAEGECFQASSPPWCTKCEKNEECPADAGYTDLCIEFQDRDGGAVGKFCGVPCTHAAGDKDGGTTPTPGDCPRGHECVTFRDENDQPIEPPSCLWMRCATWGQDAGTPADAGVPEDAAIPEDGGGGDI
ncbi:MAG: hypothetical protein HY897_23625 [Deltaproteobacteria bacterium]|nr:hypothetical protein [Deltaproteobacteria bacterium]